MSQLFTVPLRVECPPGACGCEREILLNDPASDRRVLMLTRQEEKKLLARIEAIANYAELLYIKERMFEQLGIVLQIGPGDNEVRTVRGLNIQLIEQPGLCKKTRQTVPAAVRKCLEKNPGIVYAILDADGLFGAG
ncbi:MAG TPA: hypothetical protein VN114_08975 [Oxalicibacterium sp.]|uniref:hypothetical protein n=1 Tax=Oxalicibacterium sp. TaxID=2766525 RepID=UPI002B9FF9B9|nr:hypothetical protein [Oxalicibacterium sp.]HWU98631.1 hypothetical protein [Oxalicibacterium sp.]